jgi:hypothetical protein
MRDRISGSTANGSSFCCDECSAAGAHGQSGAMARDMMPLPPRLNDFKWNLPTLTFGSA